MHGNHTLTSKVQVKFVADVAVQLLGICSTCSLNTDFTEHQFVITELC